MRRSSMCRYCLLRSVILHYPQRGGQYASLDDLDLDPVCKILVWLPCLAGVRFVDFPKGLCEFAADAHPFAGIEVVMLEEEDEGAGAEERGILPQKLGFAKLGRLVGGWLGSGVAGD